MILRVIFCLALLISAASAGIIYDNGAPAGGNGNEMTEWIQTEGFTLGGPATLTDVRFWGFTLGAGVFTETVTWRIYDDAAGNPGAVLDSGSALPAMTLRDPSVFNGSYQFDFSVGAIPLGAGTYHLGLHNGPLDTTSRLDFYWETTAGNGTPMGREDATPFDDGGWFDNGQEHAFVLYGSAVPEPGSMLLLSGALAALLAFRRFRS